MSLLAYARHSRIHNKSCKDNKIFSIYNLLGMCFHFFCISLYRIFNPKSMKRLLFFAVALLALSSASARKSPVLTYGTPESVGMNGEYLARTIDSIATASIEAGCFPGCQILVARKGKIVHHKSYGHHTTEQLRAVENSHLYDMASCTKVMAATICLMHLADQKKLDLDKPISTYLEEFKGSNKENLTLREILTHQSGLRNEGYTRIYVTKDKKLNPKWFRTEQSEEFPNHFGCGLYVHKDTREHILNRIVKQKPGKRKFHYSCYNFHLTAFLVERLTGRNYEEYLYEEFYKPLGVKDAMYNPTRKYSLEQIVPTEIGNRYRKQIHGVVHDETAAFMGGVSGNAGLFANSESLAPILQMLLNGGEYNGKRYFKRKTIKEWTSCQYPKNGNHRAVGFDRRRLNDNLPLEERTTKPYYYAPSASEKSFGHSGFTGTMVWADPKEDLVFVFLSNRVYPTRRNKTYFEVNPRSKCHEAAYEAIRRYKK